MSHYDRVLSQNMLYEALRKAGLDHDNSMMWASSPNALSVVQTALNNEYRNGEDHGRVVQREISRRAMTEYQIEVEKNKADHSRRAYELKTTDETNANVDKLIRDNRDNDSQPDKIPTIKAVRVQYPHLGLRDAKELVEDRMVVLGYPRYLYPAT